ncbi:unnamed protein product [Cuscuta campestris]|uniref:Protein FAM136A n=2 Tax=Cuscuta sect. Cleistogrammica TaxID=1824901 RepID=A0A484L861_9ASTE|nr:hypothetical protein DM860_005700 [Cuscuta australis]VFQ72503.1 unnamed protein product [Cuscuta campestris]
MDPNSAEQRIITERLRPKVDEVNRALQTHFSSVEDHVSFTLQQSYFKCAYECFDRRRKHEEIGTCVERCTGPLVNAQSVFQNEISVFQEKLQRSLLVCHDKYESSKLQANKGNAMMDLESCVDLLVQDSIKTLPHVVERLKGKMGMTD